MVETLGGIRGQDRAVSLLLRYLESGDIPPGLLFFGEEGIGKEKAAAAFVSALFCRNSGGGAGAERAGIAVFFCRDPTRISCASRRKPRTS